MTEARVTDKEALEAVGEIIRCAGHELRNALSGVAVNVEVVRSRAERQSPVTELTPFAERARQQVGVATALSDGLLALVSSVLRAAAEGTLRKGSARGAKVKRS